MQTAKKSNTAVSMLKVEGNDHNSSYLNNSRPEREDHETGEDSTNKQNGCKRYYCGIARHAPLAGFSVSWPWTPNATKYFKP